MNMESGVDNTGDQSITEVQSTTTDMFSDEKYALEEGLKALDNRPLNPLEQVQQGLVQQYNQQQENLAGSVEDISPDKGEEMAESATVEAKQEVAIEKIVAEADQISPDFGAGVKAELVEAAQQTLRMKIEGKVYDLLTTIERKIGQGLVTRSLRENFSYAKGVAKEWKDGKVYASGLDRSSQYETGVEQERDIELGKWNFKYGRERPVFVPGGEASPIMVPGLGFGPRLEKPYIDVDRHNAKKLSNSLDGGVGFAEIAVENNPVIVVLEKWRKGIGERRANISGAKQLVSNYGRVS